MDIKTIFMSLFLVTLVINLLMFIYYKTLKTYNGFKLYLFSITLMSITYFLFGLRGILPDLISIVLSNTLVVAFAVFYISAYQQFFKEKPNFKLGYLIIFFSGFVYFFFTFVYDNIMMRLFYYTVICIYAAIRIALIFINNYIKENKWLYLTLIILNACLILINLARLIDWQMNPESRALLLSSKTNILFLFFYIVYILGNSFIFVIFNSKRLSRELKEANQTKDKFFSLIAHDLKGHIGAAAKLTEYFLKEDSRFSQQERTEFLEKIKESSQANYELLENLLNWARSQQNEIHYSPEKVSLLELISTTKRVFNNILNQKNIQVTESFEENFVVYVDKAMIETVFRNLLSNVIKFSYPKSTVSVSAIKSNQEVLIYFQDNGVGIEQERLNKLFDFYSNSTTHGTENEKGTGLGLILCKDFIQRNKGKIEIKSTLGKGTTFIISLPAAE